MQSVVYKKNRLPVFKGSRAAAEAYCKKYGKGNNKYTIIYGIEPDKTVVVETAPAVETEKAVKEKYLWKVLEEEE